MARQRPGPSNRASRKRRSSAMEASDSIKKPTKGPSIALRRALRQRNRNPAFEAKLRALAVPLVPLVQLPSGDIHPVFPRSMLQYYLLTDDELESLAHFYHQRTPCRLTKEYPCPITWSSGLPVSEKRRKIGKFIGLRGCETPTISTRSMATSSLAGLGSPGGQGRRNNLEDEDEDENWETATCCGSDDSSFTTRESLGGSSETCSVVETSESHFVQAAELPTQEDIESAARRNRVNGSGDEALRRKMGWP